MKSLSLVVLFSLSCSSAALADQVGSGSATLSFDMPTITTSTPLSSLDASFGITETATELLSLPGNSPSSSLAWAFNALGTASPAGRFIQGTSLDLDPTNVLGSWGGASDFGAFVAGGEQIGFGGATRWAINPLFGGGGLLLGDFGLRYSASRVGGGRSGLVLTSNVSFTDVAFADIGNAIISVSGSVLTITGDLLISDGLIAVGFPAGTLGTDIGDFSLTANLVPAPGALALLALAPLGRRRRR